MLTGRIAIVSGSSPCAEAVARALAAAGALVDRDPDGQLVTSGATLDILACVLPTPKSSSIADLDGERWRALIDTHLTATFDLTRAALPALRASGAARLIYIVAVPGAQAGLGRRVPGHVVASGLSALAEVFALELAPYQIHVNAVVSTAPVLDEAAGAAIGQAVVSLARTTFVTGETIRLQ